MIILNMYHQPESEQELALPATCYLAGRRAGGPLWPVGCPMPAGGSAVKGRQRGRWLPVAERASPLTALQAAGTKPGAKRRAQIRTAACRGTPMPRCQGGCHLAGASLKSSTNTSLWGFEEKTAPQEVEQFEIRGLFASVGGAGGFASVDGAGGFASAGGAGGFTSAGGAGRASRNVWPT